MTVVSRLKKFMSVANSDVAKTIIQQFGGMNKLSAMTGAKDFIHGKNWVKFTIGRNSSKANRVQIVYNSGSDTYDLLLLVYSKAKLSEVIYSHDRGLDVEGIRSAFTQRTGLQLSLGTKPQAPASPPVPKTVRPAPAPAPASAPKSTELEKMRQFVHKLTPTQRASLRDILNEYDSAATAKPASVQTVEKLPATASRIVHRIAKLTDINDHTGAAIELAKFLKESTLLDDLEKIKKRSNQGIAPNDRNSRDRMIVPMLLDQVKKRFGDAAYKMFHNVF